MLSVRTYSIYALILSGDVLPVNVNHYSGMSSLSQILTFGMSNLLKIQVTINTKLEMTLYLLRYSKNTRIAYLNINSVAGFKFFELKSFIQECLFDIVVVSETKIDDSFLDSHFYIKGFRMFRTDRNRFGGGLLIYTRRGFIIHRINDLEGNKVESITLLVRSNNLSKGTLIIGAYKPPNMPENNWEFLAQHYVASFFPALQ